VDEETKMNAIALIWERLALLFSPERIGDAIARRLPDVAVAALTILVFWLLHRVFSRAIALILQRAGVDPTLSTFVQTVVRYSVLAIGVVTALDQVGVNTGSLLTSLGVIGLSVGFAARDALSNVISGLFIFWDRLFVLGDFVEIDGRYGRIDKITMRSTRMVTVDGKMVAIPNSVAVNTPVVSYTNYPGLRLDIDVTVAPHEDLGRCRALLLELVRGRPGFVEAPTPEVVVTALNDYNVALCLRAWISDERSHVRERFALREAIFETLRGAGVDMPAETLRLEPVRIEPLSVEPARGQPGAAAAGA
jgi:small conductance mechanosensitive channel